MSWALRSGGRVLDPGRSENRPYRLENPDKNKWILKLYNVNAIIHTTKKGINKIFLSYYCTSLLCTSLIMEITIMIQN